MSQNLATRCRIVYLTDATDCNILLQHYCSSTVSAHISAHW